MILALCVGFGICWNWREQIFHLMTAPLRAGGFKEQFIYTSPAEALLLYMKMAFFVGIFVACPYTLWEICAFISPGLYPHSKAYPTPLLATHSFLSPPHPPSTPSPPLPPPSPS